VSVYLYVLFYNKKTRFASALSVVSLFVNVILFSRPSFHTLFGVVLSEYYRRKFNCRRNG